MAIGIRLDDCQHFRMRRETAHVGDILREGIQIDGDGG